LKYSFPIDLPCTFTRERLGTTPDTRAVLPEQIFRVKHMTRTKRLLFLSGCLLNIAGIWIVLMLHLAYDLSQTRTVAETDASHLERVFEEHVLRTLQNMVYEPIVAHGKTMMLMGGFITASAQSPLIL
jgi:hypothetical protein